MSSMAEKIRRNKIFVAAGLIIVLFALWQIGSHLYWEITDDLYDSERVNAVLTESGLDWEVDKREELAEKMIACYLTDPKLEPSTMKRSIVLTQRGKVKSTQLFIQDVMGGASAFTDKKFLTTNDEGLKMAFIAAAKIHGNGADGEKIFEQFITEVQNGKTHQAMENTAFYDWQNKVGDVYYYVFFAQRSSQENAILVQDVRLMNRYAAKVYNYSKS